MKINTTGFIGNEQRAEIRDLPRPVRVLIMDREPIVVRGLAEAFRNETNIRICGVATSIAQATQIIQTERPDIVLSEISFADGNLFSSIEPFQALRPGLRFIIFTSHADPAYLQRAIRCNASAFVLKSSDVESILHALRASQNGGVYVDPVILGKAIGKQTRLPETLETALSGITSRPSDRELDTLKLIAFGYSIKEIARKLGVSPKSIETYKARANQKLGLVSRASIVRYAVASGWFDDEANAAAALK